MPVIRATGAPQAAGGPTVGRTAPGSGPPAAGSSRVPQLLVREPSQRAPLPSPRRLSFRIRLSLTHRRVSSRRTFRAICPP